MRTSMRQPRSVGNPELPNLNIKDRPSGSDTCWPASGTHGSHVSFVIVHCDYRLCEDGNDATRKAKVCVDAVL